MIKIVMQRLINYTELQIAILTRLCTNGGGNMAREKSLMKSTQLLTLVRTLRDKL